VRDCAPAGYLVIWRGVLSLSNMQTPREISENRAMHGIAVALLTENREHLSELQAAVEDTRLPRTVSAMSAFPPGPLTPPAPDPGFARRSRRHRYFCRESSTRHPGHRTHPGQHLATRDLRQRTMQQPTTIVRSMARRAGEYWRQHGLGSASRGPHPFQLQPHPHRGGVGKARIFTS